jgi:hypothetical protein
VRYEARLVNGGEAHKDLVLRDIRLTECPFVVSTDYFACLKWALDVILAESVTSVGNPDPREVESFDSSVKDLRIVKITTTGMERPPEYQQCMLLCPNCNALAVEDQVRCLGCGTTIGPENRMKKMSEEEDKAKKIEELKDKVDSIKKTMHLVGVFIGPRVGMLDIMMEKANDMVE